MTTASKPHRRRGARRRLWRRLTRQALLGAAGAAGSSLVGLVSWWLESR